MDLSLSDQDLAFRDEVRSFLAAELTPALKTAGQNRTSTFQEPESALAWQAILHEKGWLVPDWPVDYGGPGWTVMQRYIFAGECSRHEAPYLFPTGLKMCGPALITHGTAEQKAYYLPRILNGEHFWCQGYSEPGAGSDLASLTTAAVADGDDYIVTGAKIWTSYAHRADQIFCLVRTDPTVKPQAGISFLLIDMRSPGITVEPIITLTGKHELNQVFFDGVRVPQANRVGPENQGWTVAKHLLEFERTHMPAAELERVLARVRRIAREPAFEADPMPGFAGQLAALEIATQAIQMTELQLMARLSHGESPGTAASAMKVQKSELKKRINGLAVAALGHYAGVYQPEALVPDSNRAPVGPVSGIAIMPTYLEEHMLTIAAGSAEIQRNIIAKAVLGL